MKNKLSLCAKNNDLPVAFSFNATLKLCTVCVGNAVQCMCVLEMVSDMTNDSSTQLTNRVFSITERVSVYIKAVHG